MIALTNAVTTTSLYHTFLQERQYLNNVSPKTLTYYQNVWRVLAPHLPDSPGALTKQSVMAAISALKESGKHSDTSINCYLRGFRAFVKWAQAEGHVRPDLQVREMKVAETLIKTFSDDQLKRVLSYRPKYLDERRVWTMLIVALDTGIRMSELINLKRQDLMLDNLLIKVMGKGRKERIVPMSAECRRWLWEWLKSHPHEWVWATKRGTRITVRNSYRDLKALCRTVGVAGVRCSWHTLRHTMATNYAAAGGNVLYLRAILGHADLAMTQRYVRVPEQTLTNVHNQFSSVATLRT
jgi:integrase/recombinase XerD